MPDPISTTERVAAHQRRVIEAGGRRISLLLAPDVVEALVKLRRRTGLASDRAIIIHTIKAAAARK